MKNFIEVNGVEECSKYLVNINNIAKVYPVNNGDKKILDSVFKDDKWDMLMEFISDDATKSKLNDMTNNMLNANTIIILTCNGADKSDNNIFALDTFDEIKVKIENAS